jgi:isopentenyl-diphosphate delta-isomerase
MLKVAAYDVGGAGGTSWSLVEGVRAGGKDLDVGKTFASWGIPTAECIREVSKTKVPVIASGGIRTGIDAAKSLALGASCVGMALPVLRAWSSGGKQGVRELLDRFFCELQVAMFLTGSGSVKELKGKIRE